MKCLQIRVYGKVQGVWYRGSTQQKANALGLEGTVMNEPEGSVIIKVKGKETIIDELVEWCREGPELAIVEKIETVSIEDFECDGFRVIR